MTRAHWIAGTAAVALIVAAVVWKRTKAQPNRNPIDGKLLANATGVFHAPSLAAATHAGGRI